MRRLLTPLAVAAAFLSGCTEDPVSPIVIPDPAEPVSYTRHVAPIFARSCATASCHDDATAQSGLALTSWSKAMEGSEFGAVVVPFAPLKSHLLQHISTDTTIAPIAHPLMPYGRDPLPVEQILTIKRWIAEGAKSETGEVALSGDRPRVLATNQGEDLVSVIDLETERVARYISVGRRLDATSAPEAPHNITVSPDGRYFYVNLIAVGEIEKYDAQTFAKLGSTDVGLSPAQITLTRDGARLFVSNFDQTFTERFVTEVNPATMQAVRDIETGGYAPHGVTLSADETKLYTMNAGSDDVSEIDLATGEVTRVIPVVPGAPLQPGTKAKHEPYQAVLTPDGRYLFATMRASAQVRVIDLEQGSVVDSIPVGNRPLILEITPDGRQIWVPNQGLDNVSIIDVATRRLVGNIQNLYSQPHAIAFSPDGRKAFVTCENQTGFQHHPVQGQKRPGMIYVIDVDTRTVTRTIEVGAFAAGIVVAP